MSIYKWYRNGKLAKETKDPEGSHICKEFLPNGIIKEYAYYYNEDGVPNKPITIYAYNSNNERLISKTTPFYTSFRLDGSYRIRKWMLQENYQKVVEVMANKTIHEKYFYCEQSGCGEILFKKLHRLDGPAEVYYDVDGK